MADRIDPGIRVIEESVGSGPCAAAGATVVYNARLYLRRGDEVTADRDLIERSGDRLSSRQVEDAELVDHRLVLGKRRAIAAIEKTLSGMQPDGYREVLASPHLCYGDRGVPGRIPPSAMLRIRIWVRAVEPA